MSKLAARVLTGTTLALAVALLLWLCTRLPRGSVTLSVAALLGLLASYELERMGSFAALALRLPLHSAWIALLAFQLRLAAGSSYAPAVELGLLYALSAAGLVAAIVAARAAVRLRPRPTPAWASVPLGLWLLPPLFALVRIDRDFGAQGLVVLVVLAKVGDNAGYFVGRAIGERRPFPAISPGKTVAGCVASLVAGIAAGAVLLPCTLGEPSLRQAALGAALGGLLNVAAQASDLSESWVKRRAGVKDSSALLGPSGGVLDAIDSLFLVTPLAVLLLPRLYPPT
jgi:phosphatidate cytidylyltransferase